LSIIKRFINEIWMERMERQIKIEINFQTFPDCSFAFL
jgi:hypothetical protein